VKKGLEMKLSAFFAILIALLRLTKKLFHM